MPTNTKNLGQVAAIYIGSTPPTNTNLVWYDNTPSQMCHKVYDSSLLIWTALSPIIISNITYSELVNIAQSTGLSITKYYKITDKDNVLAFAITGNKVQYVDTSGNILIDDLGSNIQYHVTSSNLLIDEIGGVWDVNNKKLSFTFADEADINLAESFFLGERVTDSVKTLKRYKASSILSVAAKNSLVWETDGLFFDFITALQNASDVTGGVVSKDTFDQEITALETALNNAIQAYQNIRTEVTSEITDATSAVNIYNKILPSLSLPANVTNLSAGDKLTEIIGKIQKYFNYYNLILTRLQSQLPVRTLSTMPASPVNLQSQLDKKYQKFTGSYSPSSDFSINLSSTGATNGDSFVLHFNFSSVTGLDSITPVLTANRIFIKNSLGTTIKTIGYADYCEMMNKEDGIVITVTFDDSGDWNTVSQDYDLGQPHEIKMFDGTVSDYFDSNFVGKTKGYFGWIVYNAMEGRTPIGYGSLTDEANNSLSFNIGDQGGEFKHKLDVDEIPLKDHYHYNFKNQDSSQNFLQDHPEEYPTTWNSSTYEDVNYKTKMGAAIGEPDAGKSGIARINNAQDVESHNNMQPYHALAFIKKQY